jgi:hypothetical protein
MTSSRQLVLTKRSHVPLIRIGYIERAEERLATPFYNMVRDLLAFDRSISVTTTRPFRSKEESRSIPESGPNR